MHERDHCIFLWHSLSGLGIKVYTIHKHVIYLYVSIIYVVYYIIYTFMFAILYFLEFLYIWNYHTPKCLAELT